MVMYKGSITIFYLYIIKPFCLLRVEEGEYE